MKGKALRRALETGDALRVNAPQISLIEDRTELIGPTEARAMLERNTHNRPINWRKVEEYSDIMSRGEWMLHAQGIILDEQGNVLTGQKRLWAIVYSGVTIPMRVSRGNPSETAKWIDRGTPQSARDLASRETRRKHSPIEASIARAILGLAGNLHPSVDELAAILEIHGEEMQAILKQLAGLKKSRAVLMVCAGICSVSPTTAVSERLAAQVGVMADELSALLLPTTAERCWNKGPAFTLALNAAKSVVDAYAFHTKA